MIFYQTLSWVDLKKFPNKMRHSYYQMDPTHQWKSLKVFSKSCLSNTGVTNNFFWEHTVAVSKWYLTLKDKYNNQLVATISELICWDVRPRKTGACIIQKLFPMGLSQLCAATTHNSLRLFAAKNDRVQIFWKVTKQESWKLFFEVILPQ